MQTRISSPSRCLESRLLALYLTVAAGLLNLPAQNAIQFDVAEQTVSEGAGVLLVGLTREGTAAGQQITFQTVALTAGAGTDFHPISETYTFPESQTSLSLALQIFDNPTYQPDRTLKITMSDPVGLTIGSPSEITITIADNDDPSTAGPGAAGTNLLQGVFAITTNSAGAITLGGSFRTFNGQSRRHLARLLPDGSLDPGFDVGTGPNDRVWALAYQGDDRLLLAGDFTQINGIARARIARLTADGAVDPTFLPGAGADRLVESIEVLPDDRILIAGFFSSINGLPRSDVAILADNGGPDPSFAPVTPPSFVGHVARLHGDHVLLGGEVGFGPDSNVTNALMRFDLTGTRDDSFQVSIGDLFLNKVTGLIVQPDLKIVVCGDFLGVNGQPSSSLARLHANGSLDTSFNVGTGADNWVFRISPHQDGKFLAAGFFQTVNGQSRPGIARLNGDGTLDTSFDPQGGANDVVYQAIDAGDRILLGGGFSQFDGYDRFRFASLTPDGALLTAPLQFLSVMTAAGPALGLTLEVEPGPAFRLLTAPTVTGPWSAGTERRSARRTVELTQPVSGDATFLRIEQAFPASE